MASKNSTRKKRTKQVKGITSISIQGYKSLAEECTIEIRPLTILAGTNSSGKSSSLQPLLLLKQTLDANYDPGPLLISGPNVQFSSAGQMLSKLPGNPHVEHFAVEININGKIALRNKFRKRAKGGISLYEMMYKDENEITTMRPEMSEDEILALIPKDLIQYKKHIEKRRKGQVKWRIGRSRCFLTLEMYESKGKNEFTNIIQMTPGSLFQDQISSIIHVPALRGNPKRTYPATAFGDEFQGTFENYVASIIYQWQLRTDNRLIQLGEYLENLGLTWKVDAKQVDDTQVEIRVGRLPHSIRGGGKDLVNIADVGFGVSQTLPVLVSLLVANPGQLVYIEQPEIHLHPRAKIGLAKVLVDAAKRGVRVVAETHSALLLSSVQALAAEGYIDPTQTKLHWFTRREEDGVTEVDSADLDRAGTYGDWPEDFGEIDLEAQRRYLNASEQVQLEFAQRG